MKLIRFLTLAMAICWLALLPAHATLTLSKLYSFTSATNSGEYPYCRSYRPAMATFMASRFKVAPPAMARFPDDHERDDDIPRLL